MLAQIIFIVIGIFYIINILANSFLAIIDESQRSKYLTQVFLAIFGGVLYTYAVSQAWSCL